MLCASIINLAFVCSRVTFAKYSYGGWCLGSRRRNWHLPDEAHLARMVGQEIDVMGSLTNYAPHDRPQQQGSAHPTAERSPIARK